VVCIILPQHCRLLLFPSLAIYAQVEFQSHHGSIMNNLLQLLRGHDGEMRGGGFLLSNQADSRPVNVHETFSMEEIAED
jgi:hypothetical protein